MGDAPLLHRRFDLPRRHDVEVGAAPDYAVPWDDRLWMIELKAAASSHRPTQIPTYLTLARHHHPARSIDLTYLTPEMAWTPPKSTDARLAHITWNRVVPLLSKTLEQRRPRRSPRMTLLTEAIEGIGKGRAPEPPKTVQPARRPDLLQAAMELVETTSQDGRQRALDPAATSVEELQRLRLAVKKTISATPVGESVRLVQAWIWSAATSTGHALTEAGKSTGYELRRSRYRSAHYCASKNNGSLKLGAARPRTPSSPLRPTVQSSEASDGGDACGRGHRDGWPRRRKCVGWPRRDHGPNNVEHFDSHPPHVAQALQASPSSVGSCLRPDLPYPWPMINTKPDWERRIAELWATFDDHEPEDFLAKVKELAAELPADDAVANYELASAHDAIGNEAKAATHYRMAFEAGLDEKRRRQATIQYASTLRNLGRAEESVALLTAERDAVSDELDDAVTAFLALSLTDLGRDREAASLALGALSRHLPAYNRSLANYARALVDE